MLAGPGGQASGEDILEVEHDFIPLDGANVFQWREIDSIGDRVALAEAGRFPAARASAEPPCADSLATSQRPRVERRFLFGVALANGQIWNAFHIGPVAIATPIPRVKTADLASKFKLSAAELSAEKTCRNEASLRFLCPRNRPSCCIVSLTIKDEW